MRRLQDLPSWAPISISGVHKHTQRDLNFIMGEPSFSPLTPDTMHPVPAEVLDNVFRLLEDDRLSLSACSRVSRDIWFPFASQRLFRSLKFHAVVGGSYNRASSVSFRDFLAFVESCDRASTCTYNLVLDGSWTPRHQANYMAPIVVCRLGVDLLSDIVVALPALRTLELSSVQFTLPGLMFKFPETPFTLDRLILDYTMAHPLAQPDGRPGFNVSSILPIFSSLGKLVVRYGVQSDFAFDPMSVYGLNYACFSTRISDLELKLTRHDDVIHFLDAMVETLAPASLLNLRLFVNGWWYPGMLAHLLMFLSSPASRNLQTLYLHWGRGVSFTNIIVSDGALLTEDEQVKMAISPSEPLFPTLGTTTQVSSLFFTQTIAEKKSAVISNTFAATISTLLSTDPSRQQPLSTSCLRKAHLKFIFGQRFSAKDMPGVLARLPWDELDRVVEALKWSGPGYSEVLTHPSPPEGQGIEVYLGVVGEHLPNDIFIQAQDAIRSQVSMRTRRLLRIVSLNNVTQSSSVRK